MPYDNPPILSAQPTPGQAPVFNGASGNWDPVGPLSLFSAPAGALRESISRRDASFVDASALTTGTVLVVDLDLVAGDVVTNLSWVSGATPGAALTHQWAALLDSSRKVLAVSADGTSSAWAANAVKAFAVGAAFTVQTTGLYYAALMVAGTVPTLECTVDALAAVNGIAPVLAATSSTAQTTPPALAATLGALTAVVNRAYCYVT